MRVPSWWPVVVVAVAVFGLSAAWSLSAPASYVHPDEQRVGLPAQRIVGDAPVLPGDLTDFAPLFTPPGTNFKFNDTTLNTGFGAFAGSGFLHPVVLAPFYAASFKLAYLSGPLFLALAYVGAVLLLDARRSTSWSLGALVLAVPSVVAHSVMLFANLPGLALHLLAIGCVAEAIRARRTWPAAVGLLFGFLGAGVRTDYFLSFAVFVPLVGFAAIVAAPPGRRRTAFYAWGGGLAASALIAVGVFWFANASLGIPFTYLAGQEAATNATAIASTSQSAWRTLIGRVLERATAERYHETAQNYLFGFVPGLLALGMLATVRPSVRNPRLWLLIPLAFQGFVRWINAAGVLHYGTGFSWVDSSQPRYFMPIYASLALAGAFVLQDAAERIPKPRASALVAAGVALLFVVPGVAHAYAGDHGVAWILDRRTWHAEYDDAAAQLPPESIVAGNYLAKIVYTRPVLVPDAAGGRFPSVVREITDRGHPVFVAEAWLAQGVDERARYPLQITSSPHLVLVKSDVKDFYEIKVTNATVRHIFDLGPASWNFSNDRMLQATGERAYFRVVDMPNGTLPLHDVIPANAKVTVRILDDEPRTITGGYENFDSNSTVELASWALSGTGKWVVHDFTIPRGVVVTGAAYLTGMPKLDRLEVTWS